MNIAVPASDLKKIHAESIAVPGEPGMYVAGLSVYHELHCLVSRGSGTLTKPLLIFDCLETPSATHLERTLLS